MVSPPRERLVALDAFRGLTIAGMILVNNAGDGQYVFAPLRHAPWHGWTLTDLIFPSFLFIVGVSLAFSLARARQPERQLSHIYLRILRRVLLLFGIGLLLNAMYYIPWWYTFSTLRIPGVLQRIAVVYGLAAVLVLHLSPRQQAYTAVCCLVCYWAVMLLVPVPGYGAGVLTPEGNLAAYIDTRLLRGHLLRTSWDPEGLLSTVPAIATALFGSLTGQWLRTARSPHEKVTGLFVMGGLGLGLGLGWDRFFPINKNLWTSSYVVFTTGVALLVLAYCYWLIDIQGYRRMATPFVVFGVNAITVYVLSILLDQSLVWWNVAQPDGSRVALRAWLYVHGYSSWAGRWFGQAYASLLYAVTYVLFLCGCMWVLYRKHIFINV